VSRKKCDAKKRIRRSCEENDRTTRDEKVKKTAEGRCDGKDRTAGEHVVR
jgi:hypothetical protein